MKNGYARFDVGDGTLTRRVLKRCRDDGLEFEKETEIVKIGRSQYGTKTTGYIVPANVLDEERDRRAGEQELAAEKKALELEKRRAAVRQRQIDEVTAKFPQLTLKTVEQLVDSERAIYSEREVGYQFGIGIKSYWNQLGFSVVGKPTGYFVRGKRIFDTYASHQLKSKRNRISVEQLKQKWLNKYRTEQLVLAHALRFANRLQKVQRVPGLYKIKDQWIRLNQSNLIEGKVARIETKSCWSCSGKGCNCWKCGGTGVFSSRTLYEQRFLIEGTQFSFHSYERPAIVVATSCEEHGATYGRPFKSDELPVPPQHVIIELVKKLMRELFPELDKPITCTARVHIPGPKTSACLVKQSRRGDLEASCGQATLSIARPGSSEQHATEAISCP